MSIRYIISYRVFEQITENDNSKYTRSYTANFFPDIFFIFILFTYVNKRIIIISTDEKE